MAINTANNPSTLTTGVQLYTSKFIEELRERLVPVAGFSRNFTDDFRLPGTKLEVPFLSPNASGDYDREDNNFCTPTTDVLKSATVALGEHPIIKFTVTPEMVANFLPIHWQRKAELNAHELAVAIFTKIAGVPVSAKVTQTTELPYAITVPDIVELARVADSYKINPRLATLYLTPKDYYDLLKSMEFRTVGTTTITQGDLGGVDFGFRSIVCLPTSATKSFISLPDLVMLASKPYLGALTGAHGDIIVENLLTEPNTGLSMVETVVRSSCTKDVVHNLDVWYGAELGNPKAGVIVTRSATPPAKASE